MRMSLRLVSPLFPLLSLCCPPQPAAPNSTAPATPTPPAFRKLLRLNSPSIIDSPPSLFLSRSSGFLRLGSGNLLELCLKVNQALTDVADGSFALVWLGLDYGVLFEHVPASIAR